MLMARKRSLVVRFVPGQPVSEGDGLGRGSTLQCDTRRDALHFVGAVGKEPAAIGHVHVERDLGQSRHRAAVDVTATGAHRAFAEHGRDVVLPQSCDEVFRGGGCAFVATPANTSHGGFAPDHTAPRSHVGPTMRASLRDSVRSVNNAMTSDTHSLPPPFPVTSMSKRVAPRARNVSIVERKAAC